MSGLFWLASPILSAENSPKVQLDTSETIFGVLAAINSCGYDAGLNSSDPLRPQIREEVSKAVAATDEGALAGRAICQFYQDHQQPDPALTLAQYVSLALILGPPPDFVPKVKEPDFPPDASFVAGFVPLLSNWYKAANLHSIWEHHLPAYTALTAHYHDPLAKILFDTEVYLKLPSAGYLGRNFTVYLDPMGAPGETNARNYSADYFVVISPAPSATLKTDQIRHTYLHYLLDPLALKYPTAIHRLNPLLDSVKTAPMDQSFKDDISLLVTECLIRGIEARTSVPGKAAEAQREQLVDLSEKQGFILTQYFYESLGQLEKDPRGLRTAYGEMLGAIDLAKQEKLASQIQFAAKAEPELLHPPRPAQPKLLMNAEQRLSEGDATGAQKLAQQALDEKIEDPGRALFILAQVATMNKDIQGARSYFEKALGVAQEPKVIAWSHIYLGRIFDLQEDRDAALDHYRAALTAGANLPEAKAAAERGIEQPYEPPSRSQ